MEARTLSVLRRPIGAVKGVRNLAPSPTDAIYHVTEPPSVLSARDSSSRRLSTALQSAVDDLDARPILSGT